MNQFYMSLVFMGIILIMVALIGIFYDRKRSIDYANRIEAKKKELEDVINDAEKMIEEMNKLSDYVVTQVESKCRELDSGLNRAENKIGQIRADVSEPPYKKEDAELKKNNIDVGVILDKANYQAYSQMSNTSKEDIKLQKDTAPSHLAAQVQENKPDEKPVIQNSRHKEVIKLSKNGFDTAQIAKMLNIGQGEIQLILEMNK